MTAAQGLPFGLAILLAFDCYLRPNELFKLKRKHLAMPKDPRMGADFNGVALRISKAKTGENQYVEVQRTEVKQLLEIFVAGMPRNEQLFNFTPAQFRNTFYKALR